MTKRSIKGLIKISPLRDKMKDKPVLSTYNAFFNSGEGLSKNQITEVMCIIQKEASEVLAILQGYKDKINN